MQRPLRVAVAPEAGTQALEQPHPQRQLPQAAVYTQIGLDKWTVVLNLAFFCLASR